MYLFPLKKLKCFFGLSSSHTPKNFKLINSTMNRYSDWINTKGLNFKQYQYDGVSWCVESEKRSSGPKGGFLSDEMGLGKTITMLGVCIVNFVPKTLIVLPAILVDQWIFQIYKNTGHKALVWTKGKVKKEQLDRAPIVIVTYGKISVNKKTLGEGELHQIYWNRIIFDEAHHLRNNKTSKFIGAKLLKGDIRWLVSGTPIQNRLKDFYSLCSILGLASSLLDKPEIIINEYMLKRTKEEVGLGLPDMNEISKMVSWNSQDERKLAEELHSALSFSNVENNKHQIVANAFSDGSRPVLKMMMRARQSCTLPKLLSPKLQYLVNNGIIPADHSYTEGVKNSSKMDSVIEYILSRKDNGNGKLVFCQFHQEIDLIFNTLREKGIDDVVIFDGRTSSSKRKSNITEKHAILILQIQSGCEGLNLQDHYNEIYFASPHWNPSVEDQAIARCHRMGQTKIVQVFRFIMDGWGQTQEKENNIETVSFDKYVSQIQDKKRELRF